MESCVEESFKTKYLTTDVKRSFFFGLLNLTMPIRPKTSFKESFHATIDKSFLWVLLPDSIKSRIELRFKRDWYSLNTTNKVTILNILMDNIRKSIMDPYLERYPKVSYSKRYKLARAVATARNIEEISELYVSVDPQESLFTSILLSGMADKTPYQIVMGFPKEYRGFDMEDLCDNCSEYEVPRYIAPKMLSALADIIPDDSQDKTTFKEAFEGILSCQP